jgi:hypothetical protein
MTRQQPYRDRRRTCHLWRAGIGCWTKAGLRLIELAEFDPPAADVAPDVLLVSEESTETVAIELCHGNHHEAIVHLSEYLVQLVLGLFHQHQAGIASCRMAHRAPDT